MGLKMMRPTTSRVVPSWKQVTDYFTAPDRASPNVAVRTLGKTTFGRPFLVAFIADAATLTNLEKYRQIQRKLPFTSIVDKDVRAGSLNDRFDVVILPDQSAAGISRGLGNAFPDSLLAVQLTPGHPLASGMTAPVPSVWFENSTAFEITDPSRATAVAT